MWAADPRRPGRCSGQCPGQCPGQRPGSRAAQPSASRAAQPSASRTARPSASRAALPSAGAGLAALAATLLAASAEAHPTRVGVFVGSNGAPGGRAPLEHAEADAQRMRRVFVELGGIAPEDAHLLEAPTADDILQALSRLQGGAAMLVFYYSGHADDRALLLDGSELPLAELNRALEAVGAGLSLHLVDACRSGALTRRKGARLGERLVLDAAERGEGKVVITSSAEWEDSHESDRLGGSFFTLHMTTGLRGAADVDRDGRVTLSEAYAYAYGRTVEATLASASGVQHPTFAHDLSGRGELVLTWPQAAGGILRFGAGDYLVVEATTGRIAAEVLTEGAAISLPAGEYRVKKRTRSEVLSGRLRVTHGATHVADEALTEREAHARLVRKGGGPSLAHGFSVAAGLRGPLAPGVGAAGLLRVGWELSFPGLSLMPYVSATTTAGFDTPRLSYDTRELGAGPRSPRARDLAGVTGRAGPLLAARRPTHADAAGRARARARFGGAVGGQLAVESRPIFERLVVSAALEAALYAYRATAAELEPTGAGSVATLPTYRVLLGLGYEL